jgi:hypothetical protein
MAVLEQRVDFVKEHKTTPCLSWSGSAHTFILFFKKKNFDEKDFIVILIDLRSKLSEKKKFVLTQGVLI